MYSKPKGLYVKQRDRPARRLSPRTVSDYEYGSPYDTTDGGYAHEVLVESFGEGQIKADIEPLWPHRDFEMDGATAEEQYVDLGTNEPRPSTSTASDHFPIRAQKYMVTNNSYQDLVRAKYITVPKANASEKPSAERKSIIGSITSFAEVEDDIDFPLSSTPRVTGKPVAHVTGINRGLSSKTLARQSHLATIRVNPKYHTLKGVKGHIATVKAIPRDGTIRTVKGYHLGQNATVRSHNTGHAVRHLKHAMSSWDKPDGAFKRNTYRADRKEYYISEFAIELDRPDMEAYSPGDYLTGRIILEALSNIEIRFVELLIVGLASVHFGKLDPNTAKSSQEVLVSKRSYVMGTPNGRWNSVITAGKYVSRFKFKLPDNIPSTIKYESKENGFGFEVGYLVKARVCDEMGSSSTRSTHSTNNYVKVLLTRRFPFMVRQPLDIHINPRAMQPVSQSEFANIGCLPLFMNNNAVTLTLDRALVLAGDDIRVKLTTPTSTARKIKSLTCDLQQRIVSSVKSRQMFTVIQVYEQEPEGLHYKQKSLNLTLFEIIIPTHSQFIPSYLSGVKLVKASYAVMMTVKFKSCSGKLFIECPIGIGQSADPIISNGTNAVPVFNRPMRFPHFSRDGQVIAKTQNGKVHSG